MKAVRGVVRGQVQGVGFRHFTRRCAQALGVHGHVQNMQDGSVAFFIQGSEPDLGAVLDAIKQGPELSHVESCDYCEVSPDTSLQTFSIFRG